MKQRSHADQVELSLRKALRELEPESRNAPVPRKPKSARGHMVVEWSVRHKWGGLPFTYRFKVPLGCWESEAKHRAKQAIVADNLVPWMYMGIEMPE